MASDVLEYYYLFITDNFYNEIVVVGIAVFTVYFIYYLVKGVYR